MSIPGFECKADFFTSWEESQGKSYTTKDGLKLSKVPYPQLTLLQNANDTTPVHHYTELVTYLKQNPFHKSVYIHSAPVYAVLLIAAALPESVALLIDYNYPEKFLVLTAFVLNNIRDKAIFEDEA
jgi:hypothetical protein